MQQTVTNISCRHCFAFFITKTLIKKVVSVHNSLSLVLLSAKLLFLLRVFHAKEYLLTCLVIHFLLKIQLQQLLKRTSFSQRARNINGCPFADPFAGFIFLVLLSGIIITTPCINNVTGGHRYSRLVTAFVTVRVGSFQQFGFSAKVILTLWECFLRSQGLPF